MAKPPYWLRPENRPQRRLDRRRLSRRRFLAAAGLGGVGLASAAMLGCGDSGGGSPSATYEPSEVTPGGTLRFPGFEAFIFDTLDPHQTQFGPVYSSHSAVFSKLLRYLDSQRGDIGTDLARAVPEVVDGSEYVIPIHRGARFQRPSTVLDRPASPAERALDGRELTAHDVVYSFQRQMNPDSPRRPFYYRAYQYEGIESIEAVDDYTVRIVLKEPLATFLHALADTNAFIVAPELVDDEDRMNAQDVMLGTGPFIWDELQPLVEARFLRNPDWFGWGQPDMGRPYMDGYTSLFLADDATLESTFRTKKLDVALQVNDPAWVFEVRDEFPDVVGVDQGFSVWLNSRLLVSEGTFSDFRVRKALHLAVDRQQIADSLFRGYARMHGPVSPVLEEWALPQEELAALPGYRSAPADREADIAEARRLYEEAGSPDLEVVFGDQPSYVPAFADEFVENLRQTLGANTRTVIRSYVQISESHQRGDLEATWQYDNGWIEPDDWLYPFFHSTGTKNSFRLSDPDLDSMLEAQRREFDHEARRDLVRDIQRYLLEKVLARLDYVTPTNLWVAWRYYNGFNPSPFFGESYRMADAFLDQNDPSWEGRA